MIAWARLHAWQASGGGCGGYPYSPLPPSLGSLLSAPRLLSFSQPSGALSGALAAIATTPADVLKTRIMTGRAPAGMSALALATKMAREEGFFALYKGWQPRALWIAPVGAMNFAVRSHFCQPLSFSRLAPVGALVRVAPSAVAPSADEIKTKGGA